MESKLLSYKTFFAVLLILSLVQLTMAAKLYPPQMLPGKPLSCLTYGEHCNMANWCCPGTECSNSYAGGECIDDPFKACVGLGSDCGFFTATCCGKAVCTGGVCQDANSNPLAVSTIFYY